MESYGVTIQIKPLQQYFHTLQFIKYLVPLSTFRLSHPQIAYKLIEAGEVEDI